MKSRDQLPSKDCAVCGRTITWRKKWERNWENVKYCGDTCRRRGLRPVDSLLEEAILTLLAAASATATICPSQAARIVSPLAWQSLMEPARQAARRLCLAGRITVLQRGSSVDLSTAKGPIRLGKGANFG